MVRRTSQPIVYLLTFLAIFVANIASANTLWASSIFKGKTMRMIVPFAPGGGTDVFARLVARNWGRHIDGQPNFVVLNMTGAGGTIGFNHLYHRAKGDPLTVGVASAGIVQRQLVKFEGVRYDLREMPLIGNSGESLFLYARSDFGVKTVLDLKKFGRPVVMGATSRGAVGDSAMKIALDIFRIENKPLYGFPGFSAVRPALLRGEVDVTIDEPINYMPIYKSLEEEKTVVILFQMGLLGSGGNIVRDPIVPDMPTVAEVYTKLVGALTSDQLERLSAIAALRSFGRSIYLPPGAPKEAVVELRNSFMKMHEDPRFIADFKKMAAGVPAPEAVPGAQGEASLRKLLAVSPDIVELLK